MDTSSDVIGPNQFGGTGEDLGQAWRHRTSTLLLPSGQHDRGRRQPDRQLHPDQPAAGHQLRVRIGGVRWSSSTREFNDVFAFFVNGVNCALTPGTNNPITVNTINPGSNALFYVPNEPPTYDTEFDGFTVVLTCRAAVNPGVNNTLRLVIADTSDGILDSGVFLQANGVSSNPIGPLQPITPNRLLDTRRAGRRPPAFARSVDGGDRARRHSISRQGDRRRSARDSARRGAERHCGRWRRSRVPDDLPGWRDATWHVECELRSGGGFAEQRGGEGRHRWSYPHLRQCQRATWSSTSSAGSVRVATPGSSPSCRTESSTRVTAGHRWVRSRRSMSRSRARSGCRSVRPRRCSTSLPPKQSVRATSPCSRRIATNHWSRA